MLTTIQDAVKQLLPHKRKTNPITGWISFDAPCCESRGLTKHKSQRGGLVTNPDGGVSYHCFNCGFITSYQPGRPLSYKFRKLLGWFGASENDISRLVIEAIRVRELFSPEELEEKEVKEEVNFKVRPLPEGALTFYELLDFYILNDGKNIPENLNTAVDYIQDRRIDFEKYNFYWTPETEHNYHKRVIIPLYWKKQLIGSTARTFADGVKPKYYSDYEANYVFNTDMQTPEKQFVIVVEGPFDAMSIDGVAIMSNECNRIQADIIDDLDREVIVVPDRDRAGAKLVDQAILYGWSVSFPVWQETCKDVNEAVVKYGKLFVLKSIIDGKETNRLKIELKKKKLYN